MALTINVKGGTPKFDGKRLCDSCQHSLIMKTSDGKEFVDCTYQNIELTHSVVECNQYKDIKDKDQYELEQIAWILETKNGKTIGFKPPKRRGED